MFDFASVRDSSFFAPTPAARTPLDQPAAPAVTTAHPGLIESASGLDSLDDRGSFGSGGIGDLLGDVTPLLGAPAPSMLLPPSEMFAGAIPQDVEIATLDMAPLRAALAQMIDRNGADLSERAGDITDAHGWKARFHRGETTARLTVGVWPRIPITISARLTAVSPVAAGGDTPTVGSTFDQGSSRTDSWSRTEGNGVSVGVGPEYLGVGAEHSESTTHGGGRGRTMADGRTMGAVGSTKVEAAIQWTLQADHGVGFSRDAEAGFLERKLETVGALSRVTLLVPTYRCTPV